MILRRLAALIPTLLIASVVVFMLVQLIPGDPALTVTGEGATHSQNRWLLDNSLAWDVYVPLVRATFACTALVIDAYAGAIVGWECSVSKETEFVERAIGQAAVLRLREGNPLQGGTIHHSDAGSQDISVRFAETLLLEGLTPSIGTVGDAYDNALAETTIGLYKNECTRSGSSIPHRAFQGAQRPGGGHDPLVPSLA